MRECITWAALLLVCAACHDRPRLNPNVLVVALPTGPNNLDPRVGLDDASQKIGDLIFDSLFEHDDRLRLSPKLAERLDHPTATTYVVTLRRGVRFHDGHELTAADVVFTFRSFLDPDFVSSRKGGYRELQSVDALDRYSVLFTLHRPFTSFPINLIMPIVPDGAGPELARNPVGTGPYRFVRYAVDDLVELAPFADYHGGPPSNEGLILKVVPDDIMRGLELRKGTTDLVVNDLTPDIAFELEKSHQLKMTEAPGVDYQYIGLNLLDPVLGDVRVRQALAHAIDSRSIIQYLRRGLARPATGLLPQQSWAVASDLEPYRYDPDRARALLDLAGYRDPDGDGPSPRLRLELKISSAVEFNRLQAAVIQQNLRDVGVDLDVRTFEFATLFSDVLEGNFQMYTLQWTAGSLADPDILRRVFHSDQVPPLGFNRGHYSNPEVDRLLDEAGASSDEARRLELFQATQRLIVRDVPYISLWTKTNFVVAQPSLEGVRVSLLGDFTFLKDVKRVHE
jgi:peptide/nickel transport system substrate-binding protein